MLSLYMCDSYLIYLYVNYLCMSIDAIAILILLCLFSFLNYRTTRCSELKTIE